MNRAFARGWIVAALLAAAAGWYFRNPARTRPVSAARLLPPETLLLAECPDLPGAASRWQETALAQIAREPEVAAFLARPLARIRQSGAWQRAFAPLVRLQPRNAFLAVVNVTDNMPHAVAGCLFTGKREEAEAFLAEARARAQAASPQGEFKREPFGPWQIESFSANGVTVAACLTGDALFAANDVELLKATIARASGKLPVALDTAAAYRKSVKHLPRACDFRLFVQPSPASDKLLARFVPAAARETGKIEAIAIGGRFEGSQLRERLFLLQKQVGPHPRLSQKTMGLTTPHTLFYGALAPLWNDEGPGPSGLPPAAGRPMRILMEALDMEAPGTAAPSATLAQYKDAFGPEHALLLEWPGESPQPSLFLAMEVRRPALARKFAESAFRAWTRADAGGISFWIHNGKTPLHPAVALTERHFLAGLSAESLAPFAAGALRAPAAGGPLARSAPFIGAMAAVNKPEIGLAYLDAGPFFERFYGWLRPLAVFWGTLKMGDLCDFGKLPSPETISRHLAPVSLSAVQTRSGLLLESTGPVTFLEVGAGLGAAGLVALGPTLQITPRVSKPPLRPSPLSAPEPPPPRPAPSP